LSNYITSSHQEKKTYKIPFLVILWVGYAVGVVLPFSYSLPATVSHILLPVVFSLILLIIICKKRNSGVLLCLFLSVCLAVYYRQNWIYGRNQWSAEVAADKIISGIGTIESVTRFGFERKIIVAVKEVVCPKANIRNKLNHRIQLTFPFEDERMEEFLHRGKGIRFKGSGYNIANARNLGEFNEKKYLQGRGVFYGVRVRHPDDWSPLLQNDNWVITWIESKQESIQKRVTLGMDKFPREKAVLLSMLFGFRDRLPEELETLFTISGTQHLFAISGLHVGLLALLLLLLTRITPYTMKYSIFIIVPILYIYVQVTGAKPSSLRAFWMVSIYLIGRKLNRETSGLRSLAVAFIVITFWEPFEVLSRGFILSFAVVFTLCGLAPPIHDRLRAYFAPDPFLPPQFVSKSRRMEYSLWGLITGAVAVCFAAWIGSAPLVWNYFNMITFKGLVANIFIIPLSYAIVGFAFLSFLTSFLWDVLAVISNQVQQLTILLLIEILEKIIKIPLPFIHVRAVPNILILGTYAGLLLFFGKNNIIWGIGRRKLWFPVFFVGVSICYCYATSAPHSEMAAFSFPSGSSIYLKTEQENILIDVGDKFTCRRIVLPALRALGVNQLDWLLLSHKDKNHIGGAKEILTRFPKCKVIICDPKIKIEKFQVNQKKGQSASFQIQYLLNGDVFETDSFLLRNLYASEKGRRANQRCPVLFIKGAGVIPFLFLLDQEEMAGEIFTNILKKDLCLIINTDEDGMLPSKEVLRQTLASHVVLAGWEEGDFPSHIHPLLLERLSQLSIPTAKTKKAMVHFTW